MNGVPPLVPLVPVTPVVDGPRSWNQDGGRRRNGALAGRLSLRGARSSGAWEKSEDQAA